MRALSLVRSDYTLTNTTDHSIANLPLLGVPASVAFGYVFRTVHNEHY
jgi:hypothetical protein